MGTEKRERQKANRQLRLEQLAKEARKEKTKRRSLQIGLVVVGGLVILFGAAWLFGGNDDSSASSATTVPTITLAPGTTTAGSPATTVVPATTDPNASTTTEGPTTTVATAFVFGTAPCPAADGSTEKPETFAGAPKQCIDDSKTYTAEVTTNKGSFTISLDAERSPGNVNNFVTLARYGYYDGTGCHRVIKDFVVQCGRPGTDETAPGYTVPDELPSSGEYAEGVVAMANTGQPNTGGGQWFVITGAEGAALPPQYTIIGTVTKGYETTVQTLENLADPLAEGGTPPLVPIDITSVRITES